MKCHPSQWSKRTSVAYLKQRDYERNHVRYKIVVQGRRPGGCIPGANPRDWKSWRVFASPAILFHTEEEAWAYTNIVDVFTGLNWKKMSFTIMKVII